MAQVVLEHLTKVFAGPRGEGIRAVDCVSLTVEDKELLVLLGPSGCGKTTTLRLIAGLEEATTGTVSIDGRVVNGVAPENRDIAMVFQNHALYPHMTAFENMAFGLKLRKVPRAEIAARVGEAAEILGLAACLERKPAALSGGERQRVALGRAMVRRPRVFLFDEPLSNLDAALRQQMRAEIARLRRRLVATMIYVTHDQDEALTLGDRIAVMKQGVIQQVTDPMNLYRNPANLFVAGFVGSPPMNFFKGAVVSMRGGLFFQEQTPNGAAPLKPITLRLAESSAGTLQAYLGKQVILGIRPENIMRAAGAGEALLEQAVEAVVDVVQPMGSETHIHLAGGAHPFVARVPASDPVRAGQKLSLTFEMGSARFFDPETHRAIV
ncbi:MAG: ABC transporter ATP-binding protein [Verrucomicrobiota bacterium]